MPSEPKPAALCMGIPIQLQRHATSRACLHCCRRVHCHCCVDLPAVPLLHQAVKNWPAVAAGGLTATVIHRWQLGQAATLSDETA